VWAVKPSSIANIGFGNFPRKFIGGKSDINKLGEIFRFLCATVAREQVQRLFMAVNSLPRHCGLAHWVGRLIQAFGEDDAFM